MRCPLCHEPSLYRHHRDGWRRLMPGMQAIRCHYCFKHFYYFLGMLFARK